MPTLVLSRVCINDKMDVARKDIFGCTLLFVCKTAAEIEYVVSMGANIHHKNNQGETALFWMNSVDTIRCLVKLGCRLDVSNYRGEDVVTHAIRKQKSSEVIRYLSNIILHSDYIRLEDQLYRCARILMDMMRYVSYDEWNSWMERAKHATQYTKIQQLIDEWEKIMIQSVLKLCLLHVHRNSMDKS